MGDEQSQLSSVIERTLSNKTFHCPACSFFDKQTFKCSWKPRSKQVPDLGVSFTDMPVHFANHSLGDSTLQSPE